MTHDKMTHDMPMVIRDYNDAELLQCLQVIKNEGNNEKVMQMCVIDNGCYRYNGTALMLALNLNKSMEAVFKLIEIGGKELVMMMDRNYGETALHYACGHKNMSVDIVTKLVEIGGQELIMMKDNYGRTALQYACGNRNVSLKIVSKLIEEGGLELLMVKDNYGGTALHKAYGNRNIKTDVVSKLIEKGGSRLVMVKAKYGKTALHYVCSNRNISNDAVSKLIEEGGAELLMARDNYGKTALHDACRYGNGWNEVITKLLQVGGLKLVMVRDNYGKTALHDACRYGIVSIDVITKLVEVGRQELLMVKDSYGFTVLHTACKNPNVYSTGIVSKLIEVGGPELLTVKDKNGNIALHHAYFYNGFAYYFYQNKFLNPDFNDKFASLVKESILANIGGEFGLGGLFNVAGQKVQQKIYEKWDKILPILNSTFETLEDQQKPPILHAAILAKAPLNVIRSIINQFKYSVSKVDSLSRYPIEVAFVKGRDWTEGLQEVVKATSALQLRQSRIMYSAAQYGYEWGKYYMKELVEENVGEIMNGYHSLTGLRLFMIAAMGDCCDLGVIYGMMKMGPEMNVIAEEED